MIPGTFIPDNPLAELRSGLRTLIFDLDGTLRFNRPSYTEAFFDHAVSLGVQVDPERRRRATRWTHYYWAQSDELYLDLQTYPSAGDEFWLNYTLRSLRAFDCPALCIQDIAALIHTYMTTHHNPVAWIPPDVPETLTALKSAGYQLALVTNRSQVDAFLPPYEPRQVLDPAEPVSIGAMVGPEAFMEVRFLAHAKQRQALELIPAWASEFKRIFGRDSGGLTHTYRLEDAETVVVALGSVLGTIKDTVDEMREQGVKIVVLGITWFRPWPTAAVRTALAGAKRVVVLEKSLAVGLGGIVSNNVSASDVGSPDAVHAVIAGQNRHRSPKWKRK